MMAFWPGAELAKNWSDNSHNSSNRDANNFIKETL